MNVFATTVFGGTPVQECGWPSTVALRSGGSLCTGTLIHPQVVMYAAHCGQMNQAIFGENMNTGISVNISRSAIIGNFSPGSGQDFAYALLAQPVNFVRPTPILMGCELDVLQPGTEVHVVGFGQTDTGNIGIKHEVNLPFNGFVGPEASIGGNGKDSCQGDSGGPVFVKLSGVGTEEQWRVFGITSYGGACGQGGFYSLAHNGVDWMEEETGFDLTPCHDSDGTWNPNADCTSFPKNPQNAIGDFNSMCGDENLTGFADTCGAPFQDSQGPESNAPIIAMIETHNAVQLNENENARNLNFSFDIQDESVVSSVTFTLNNEAPSVISLNNNIGDFAVTLSEGNHRIVIDAVDEHGNSQQEVINLVVSSANNPTPLPSPNPSPNPSPSPNPDSDNNENLPDSNSEEAEPVVLDIPGCQNNSILLYFFPLLLINIFKKKEITLKNKFK